MLGDRIKIFRSKRFNVKTAVFVERAILSFFFIAVVVSLFLRTAGSEAAFALSGVALGASTLLLLIAVFDRLRYSWERAVLSESAERDVLLFVFFEDKWRQFSDGPTAELVDDLVIILSELSGEEVRRASEVLVSTLTDRADVLTYAELSLAKKNFLKAAGERGRYFRAVVLNDDEAHRNVALLLPELQLLAQANTVPKSLDGAALSTLEELKCFGLRTIDQTLHRLQSKEGDLHVSALKELRMIQP